MVVVKAYHTFQALHTNTTMVGAFLMLKLNQTKQTNKPNKLKSHPIMELKFTIKIKDEQNPPTFNQELGKGVLETIIVDFKGATDEDLDNNPQFIRQVHQMMDKFKEDWIEVKYEKL
jgi:hypothetical protein